MEELDKSLKITIIALKFPGKRRNEMSDLSLLCARNLYGVEIRMKIKETSHTKLYSADGRVYVNSGTSIPHDHHDGMTPWKEQ